jgi:hypothetical protein
MGTWGYGPFDNDHAADFAGDVSEAKEPDEIAAQLRDAMTAVAEAGEYIDSSEMCCALAAASILSICANPALPVPASLHAAWVTRARAELADGLRGMAVRVFDRALDPEDNEWHDLWLEAGFLDEVRDELERYRSALA